MVDVAADKLQGELMDLQHGSAFIKNAKIQASTGMFCVCMRVAACVSMFNVHINLFTADVDFDQMRTIFLFVCFVFRLLFPFIYFGYQ